MAFLNLREDFEWIGQSELYAMPAGWDAEYGGTGTGPATVFLLARAAGTFTAPMGFQKFPSDDQSLPIRLYLQHPPDPMMRSQIVIQPKATLAKDLASRKTSTNNKDTLSGWDIDSTNAREFEHIDFDILGLKGGGGAFDNYMDKVMELGFPVEDSTRLSAAEFNIVIVRKSSYFVLNYVLIVALLTAVSWLTFFLDPTGLDARAGVALTLLLAIGVFQLILNDTMPKTGYLTPMHVFVLMSTFWVVMVLVESLIVCELSKRQAVKESVVERMASLPRLRSAAGVAATHDAEHAGLAATHDAEHAGLAAGTLPLSLSLSLAALTLLRCLCRRRVRRARLAAAKSACCCSWIVTQPPGERHGDQTTGRAPRQRFAVAVPA